VQSDVDLVSGYSEGFLVCAKPFACQITPRLEERWVMIMKEFGEAEVEVSRSTKARDCSFQGGRYRHDFSPNVRVMINSTAAFLDAP